MNTISDLSFFVQLVKHHSLSALAREMSVTPSAVSTRLAQMERRLGVRLLNRTTRRLSPTPEGEMYLSRGSHLLAELEELDQMVSNSRAVPKGLLRVNASFGFGRCHVAPAISQFVRRYPEVSIQLALTDRPMNLMDEAFDVGISVGAPPDSRVVARRIAANRRLLCASPRYLKSAGRPATPRDLQKHPCLILRENDAAYGTWHLHRGRRQETVKVRGPLSSNDGETVLGWALEGHGVLMRSEWDVEQYLRSGALEIVLPDWSLPDADVYAIYPERTNLSAKVTAFIDFLSDWFAGRQSWRTDKPARRPVAARRAPARGARAAG